VRLMAEGCQSAKGNAERRGAYHSCDTNDEEVLSKNAVCMR